MIVTYLKLFIAKCKSWTRTVIFSFKRQKKVRCPDCERDVIPNEGGAYTAGEDCVRKILFCPECGRAIDD